MAQLRARLAVFVRERRGALPQRAFARKTGLAQSTIMRIENQDQNVTLETLEQLCRVFHVDVADLFPQPVSVSRYPWLSSTAAQRVGMVHERQVNQVEKPGAASRSRGKASGSGAAAKGAHSKKRD